MNWSDIPGEPHPAPAVADNVEQAHRWATDLAKHMAAKFYPEATQWKPLPDLLGVITQIDNMTTGLTRAAPAVSAEAGQGEIDISPFADWTPAQKLGYIESVLRWAACGYVHTPDRMQSLREAWKLAGVLYIQPAPPSQGQWISVHDQVPEPGTECLIWLHRPAWATPYAAIDTWDALREDPTGMGGPTIETGVGWGNFEFEDVSHWMPLPAAPTQPPAEDAT